MNLPHCTRGLTEGLTSRSASLDRIDNSVGYAPGNVRFVSVMANLAKWTWSDDELVSFCRDVVAFADSKLAVV